MGLTAGIVGLPNVGKSTLFNAITKSKVLSANYPFATIDPNVGVVEINDERLNKIVAIVHPKSVVYTNVSFTDIAGLVKGASLGEGLGNQFLSHIRQTDAICHVVRCFDGETIHINGKVDPLSDIEIINLELIIADLDVVNKRIGRVEKKAQVKDPEAIIEYRTLLKIKKELESEKFAITAQLNNEEKTIVQGFGLLTMKPVIYIMNTDDEGIKSDNIYIRQVIEYAKKNNANAVKICAKIEEELNELEDDERSIFMQELGIKESGLQSVIAEVYDLLGLATFFTAGEKECRAWTFKKGMKAPECAGIIHSDFEKGFIKAEVISYDDFMKYGGMNRAKEAGKMRIEGKEYTFKDGDITLFRFNI